MIEFLLKDALTFHVQLEAATGIRDIGLKIAKGLLDADEIKLWLLRKATGKILITGNITIKI